MVTVVLLLALILGGGGGYWFVLGPGAGGETAEASDVEPEPELGVVQSVESVSINLADGRYLRLGVALQLSAGVEEEINPSKAIDTAIALFSGRSVDEVSSAEGRVALKLSLAEQLREAYHDEVIDVYLTEYVTQ